MVHLQVLDLLHVTALDQDRVQCQRWALFSADQLVLKAGPEVCRGLP